MRPDSSGENAPDAKRAMISAGKREANSGTKARNSDIRDVGRKPQRALKFERARAISFLWFESAYI